MTPKKIITQHTLDKLPAAGPFQIYWKILKIERQTLHDWMKRYDMPAHLTDDGTPQGVYVIVKSEFTEWLKETGRLRN